MIGIELLVPSKDLQISRIWHFLVLRPKTQLQMSCMVNLKMDFWLLAPLLNLIKCEQNFPGNLQATLFFNRNCLFIYLLYLIVKELLNTIYQLLWYRETIFSKILRHDITIQLIYINPYIYSVSILTNIRICIYKLIRISTFKKYKSMNQV